MMSRAYPPLMIIGAILALTFALTFGILTDPALSDTHGAAPDKQFHLPPRNKSGLTPGQKRGQPLYHYYCATCHGDTGNADGFNAYSLTPPPPKLSSAKFMAPLSDATIERAIKDGGLGLGLSPHMPPWGGVLTDRDISDLTQFLHTLVKP
jgi:mono/diheme cytochrome c family protein